jgi:hypothetical protein
MNELKLISLPDNKTEVIAPASWSGWANEYLEIKAMAHQNKKTVASHVQAVRMFDDYLCGVEISSKSYGEFYHYMVTSKSKSYASKVLIRVNAFLRWCEACRLIDRSPHWDFKVPKVDPMRDQKIITEYEYHRIRSR